MSKERTESSFPLYSAVFTISIISVLGTPRLIIVRTVAETRLLCSAAGFPVPIPSTIQSAYLFFPQSKPQFVSPHSVCPSLLRQTRTTSRNIPFEITCPSVRKFRRNRSILGQTLSSALSVKTSGTSQFARSIPRERTVSS